jgi:hypothetical protein
VITHSHPLPGQPDAACKNTIPVPLPGSRTDRNWRLGRSVVRSAGSCDPAVCLSPMIPARGWCRFEGSGRESAHSSVEIHLVFEVLQSGNGSECRHRVTGRRDEQGIDLKEATSIQPSPVHEPRPRLLPQSLVSQMVTIASRAHPAMVAKCQGARAGRGHGSTLYLTLQRRLGRYTVRGLARFCSAATAKMALGTDGPLDIMAGGAAPF